MLKRRVVLVFSIVIILWGFVGYLLKLRFDQKKLRQFVISEIKKTFSSNFDFTHIEGDALKEIFIHNIKFYDIENPDKVVFSADKIRIQYDLIDRISNRDSSNVKIEIANAWLDLVRKRDGTFNIADYFIKKEPSSSNVRFQIYFDSSSLKYRDYCHLRKYSLENWAEIDIADVSGQVSLSLKTKMLSVNLSGNDKSEGEITLIANKELGKKSSDWNITTKNTSFKEYGDFIFGFAKMEYQGGTYSLSLHVNIDNEGNIETFGDLTLDTCSFNQGPLRIKKLKSKIRFGNFNEKNYVEFAGNKFSVYNVTFDIDSNYFQLESIESTGINFVCDSFDLKKLENILNFENSGYLDGEAKVVLGISNNNGIFDLTGKIDAPSFEIIKTQFRDLDFSFSYLEGIMKIKKYEFKDNNGGKVYISGEIDYSQMKPSVNYEVEFEEFDLIPWISNSTGTKIFKNFSGVFSGKGILSQIGTMKCNGKLSTDVNDIRGIDSVEVEFNFENYLLMIKKLNLSYLDNKYDLKGRMNADFSSKLPVLQFDYRIENFYDGIKDLIKDYFSFDKILLKGNNSIKLAGTMHLNDLKGFSALGSVNFDHIKITDLGEINGVSVEFSLQNKLLQVEKISFNMDDMFYEFKGKAFYDELRGFICENINLIFGKNKITVNGIIKSFNDFEFAIKGDLSGKNFPGLIKSFITNIPFPDKAIVELNVIRKKGVFSVQIKRVECSDFSIMGICIQKVTLEGGFSEKYGFKISRMEITLNGLNQSIILESVSDKKDKFGLVGEIKNISLEEIIKLYKVMGFGGEFDKIKGMVNGKIRFSKPEGGVFCKLDLSVTNFEAGQFQGDSVNAEILVANDHIEILNASVDDAFGIDGKIYINRGEEPTCALRVEIKENMFKHIFQILFPGEVFYTAKNNAVIWIQDSIINPSISFELDMKDIVLRSVKIDRLTAKGKKSIKGYDIERFEIKQKDGFLSLKGEYQSTGKVHFDLNAKKIELYDINKILGNVFPIRGKGNVQAHINFDKNTAGGKVTFDFKDLFINKIPISLLNGDFKIEEGVIKFDLLKAEFMNQKIELSGKFPLKNYSKKNEELGVTFSVKDGNMGLFSAFSEFIESSSGTADIILKLTGKIEKPVANGSINFKDSELKLKFLRNKLTGISSKIIIENNKVLIIPLKGNLNQQKFVFGGQVNFDNFFNPNYKIIFKAEEFDIIYPYMFSSEFISSQGLYYHGKINTNLSIEGNLTSGALKGDVNLYDGTIDFPQSSGSLLSSIKLPYGDINVDIHLKKNIWYKNRYVDCELGGKLNLQMDSVQTSLTGRIIAVRGKMNYLNRRFDIEEGYIDLSSLKSATADPLNEMSLQIKNVDYQLDNRLNLTDKDIRFKVKEHRLKLSPVISDDEGESGYFFNMKAKTVIRDYEVYIEASGDHKSPMINFYSRPSLSKDEIYTMLAGGYVDRDRGSFRGNESSDSGDVMSLLGSGLKHSVWNRFSAKLAKNLNLNEFSIEDESLEPGNYDLPSMRIGKYLDDDLYFTYSTSMTHKLKKQSFGIEYRLKDNIMLDSRLDQSEQEEDFQFGVKVRRNF